MEYLGLKELKMLVLLDLKFYFLLRVIQHDLLLKIYIFLKKTYIKYLYYLVDLENLYVLKEIYLMYILYCLFSLYYFQGHLSFFIIIKIIYKFIY